MKEIRHVELRAQEQSDAMIVTGTPVVFNTPAKINDMMGGFTEVIKRNALDGVDLNDTRLLYNHDFSRIPLAKTPKTMEVWTDNEGLHMRATLPDTEEGRSVYAAVQSGRLDGMSFSFTCDKDGQSYDAQTQIRSISRINKLLECSIVPFPAYQETSVEARNQMQEAQQKEQAKKQAMIDLNKLLIGDVE